MITHPAYDRITLDPSVCMGRPCIRGMRMPVASVLHYLGAGMTVDEILRDWPELESEDILQAIGYASWMMDERVIVK